MFAFLNWISGLLWGGNVVIAGASELIGNSPSSTNSIAHFLLHFVERSHHNGEFNAARHKSASALLSVFGVVVLAVADMWGLEAQWHKAQEAPTAQVQQLTQENKQLVAQLSEMQTQNERLWATLSATQKRSIVVPPPSVTTQPDPGAASERAHYVQQATDAMRQSDDLQHELFTAEQDKERVRNNLDAANKTIADLQDRLGKAQKQIEQHKTDLAIRDDTIVFPALIDKAKVPTILTMTHDMIAHRSPNAKDRFTIPRRELEFRDHKLWWHGRTHTIVLDPSITNVEAFLTYWKERDDGWELMRTRHRLLYGE